MVNASIPRYRALPLLALAIVSLALFSNTLSGKFLWDDRILIADNLYIRNFNNIPRFLTPRYWNESSPSSGVYRPVREISLALDYYFWKENPAGYRVTNILIHAVSVLLVFSLAGLLTGAEGAGGAQSGTNDRTAFAFLTALFFAVHPIHTESINLVKNRSDLLAMLFFLISLLLFIRHLSAAGRIRSWLMLAGAWLCFIPAVVSKEMALSLPGVAALYAACFLDGSKRKKALIRVIPYGVMILGFLWFMHTFIRPGDPLPPNVPLPANTVQRVLTVMKTLGFYPRMLLVPFPMSLEHPFPIPVSPLDPDIVIFLCLLVLSGVLAVRSLAGNRIVLFAIGWIGLTLVPSANIVYLVSRPVAEQRLYIPSLGFCLLLVCGVRRLAAAPSGRLNRNRAAAIGGLALIVYAALTVQRNRDWGQPILFYSKVLAGSPSNARMHNNLGVALSESGRYEEAVDHYQAALRLDPYNIRAYNNLGLVMADSGRPVEAIDYFQRAIALNPTYAEVHINLGAVLAIEGRLEEAIRHYRIALDLLPDSAWAHHNLAVAFSRTGKTEEALDQFFAAIALDPDFTEAYVNLGAALAKAGRSGEAIAYYESALRLDPGNVMANSNLGVEMARRGQWEDAIRFFMRAIALDPDYVDAHVNLGLALGATGRSDEAIRHYETAMRLEPGSADAHNRLGAELLKAGRREESIRHFFDALRLQPDHAQALNNLGLALSLTGRVDEAAGYLQTALRLMPDSADICCNLGKARLLQGRRKEAEDLLSRALQLDPDSEKAQRAYRECLEAGK